MTAAIGVGPEGLTQMIRCEQRGTSWPAMHRRRLNRSGQVVLCRHVAHSVVNEHGVELPVQSHATHVADMVLARRIQFPAVRQHAVGHIDEDELLDALLHVRRVITAAASQLEHRLDAPVGGLLHRVEVEGRLFLVILGRRQQRPPFRELVVQLWCRHGCLCTYVNKEDTDGTEAIISMLRDNGLCVSASSLLTSVKTTALESAMWH